MTTPELRFDTEGYLDLSVFPDVEPDVFGHGPGPLDPALDRDRRTLDTSFDDRWIDTALQRAATTPASTDDHLLLALVPTAGVDPGHPAPTAVIHDDQDERDADEDNDHDEIAIVPLTSHTDPSRASRAGGAA